MAIKDMKGTVTTTGIMNQRPKPLKVADMSKMKMPTNKNVNTPKEPPQQIKQQPKQIEEPNLLSKIENLTDQDKAVLGTVLSPSVSKVLSKIAPDIQPLLNQFTKEEENVVLPVSIVKNFASRKYGGTEQESIQSFVSDLAGQQMEQETTVPPDTQIAETPESGMEDTFNEVDSGMDESESMLS
tara:strand:- start:222 stop:773 length:552 start_codon:yes stop_codon:yes gene_type:complete